MQKDASWQAKRLRVRADPGGVLVVAEPLNFPGGPKRTSRRRTCTLATGSANSLVLSLPTITQRPLNTQSSFLQRQPGAWFFP